MAEPVPPLEKRPLRLRLITVPLLIGVFYNALTLLMLPFSGDTLNAALEELSATSGQTPMLLSAQQVAIVLWAAFVLTSVLIIVLYSTYRAVLEGRRWGRRASVVLALLTLLFGGIAMLGGLNIVFSAGVGLFSFSILMGAFDREVKKYTSG